MDRLSLLPHEIRRHIFRLCQIAEILECCAEIASIPQYTTLEHARENYMVINMAHTGDRCKLTTHWLRMISRHAHSTRDDLPLIVSNIKGNLDTHHLFQKLCGANWEKYCDHCCGGGRSNLRADTLTEPRFIPLADCAFKITEQDDWQQFCSKELTQRRWEYQQSIRVYRTKPLDVEHLIRRLIVHDQFVLYQPCKERSGMCRVLTTNVSGFCNVHHHVEMQDMQLNRLFFLD